jgi:hypothetical protein
MFYKKEEFMKRTISLAALVTLISVQLFSRENIGVNGGRVSHAAGPKSGAAACSPGSGRTDLDLNNVRALIFTSGDMWWDLNNSPKYEVPKGSNRHSAFASALWIGGVDNGGNLKVAAMTYRQTGNDFWPGPLKLDDASITSDVCLAYDKHWKITKQEVEEYVFGVAPSPSEAIETWPGNGDASNGYPFQLAPFTDLNGDGEYDPFYRDSAGIPEHPKYDITGDLGCDAGLFGDQTIWWVFNDKGNIHSETGGFPIGLEIRAQAFSFATNNALNNMTFYKYEIINRSTFTVEDCYFGQWVDSDLGNYLDDYVGCDVGRGLGYTYNGDADDETATGYGLNPPAFGLDFFEGPFMDSDSADGISDPTVEPFALNGLGFGDGIIDNERIGMSKFVYYNNDFSITGNPEDAQDIYNYLRGRWKDGTQMVYGGSGYGTGVPTNFMFPGDTDPLGIGQMVDGAPAAPQDDWDETSEGNTPADRRFVQSAGPFTLAPGAVNTITVGAVWARASAGGPTASVELLRLVDDDAQALFDNCFSIINGPDAPFAEIVELDKAFVMNFPNTNTENIRNYRDTTAIPGFGEVSYAFQGYQVYQLKDLTVTVNDLKDPSRARLVAQCDLEDSISQVVNRYYDISIEENVPQVEVTGENEGIQNSFYFTTDAFATGDNRLINHKSYYFLVLSYSVSENTDNTFNTPYLAGRRTQGLSNLQVYTVIPHNSAPLDGGTSLQSQYGDRPSMTRIEGNGNGGNEIDLTDASVSEILSSNWSPTPTYQRNFAPVDIKVVNPLSVPDGDFEFKLLGTADTSHWTLSYNGSTYFSQSTIGSSVEEIITDWGFAVNVSKTYNPGDPASTNNGFIDATIEFADNTKRWLSFLQDEDGCDNAANWIRSGIAEATDDDPLCGDLANDNGQIYEKVLGGSFAPWPLVNRNTDGPGVSGAAVTQTLTNLKKTPSIDIVFTPDQSKWSRCPVLETNDVSATSEGGVRKLAVRSGASLGKDGNPDGTGFGMSWFPGYAINLETGERLNIAFGESSRLAEDNGRDMKFNPSSRTIYFSNGLVQNAMGGKHYIYVFGHSGDSDNDMPRYDEGQFLYQKLSQTPSPAFNTVFSDCIWVGLPLSVPAQDWLSNEVKVRLRVTKPFAKNLTSSDVVANPVNGNNPMYRFNTSDMAARRGDAAMVDSLLNLINVVPNPYYAYSSYETGQLDNRVKITNLPKDCKITIYTSNGVLVRTYNKGDEKTSLDWDLKNQAGIPISSGIYIIHVVVPGVGERVVKWFGVLRPIDLDSF